jgi:hypothetical protein
VEDADLEADMVNPINLAVEENTALLAQYDGYECLKLQLAALARLQA